MKGEARVFLPVSAAVTSVVVGVMQLWHRVLVTQLFPCVSTPQLQGGVGFLQLLCFSALATTFVTNSLYEMTSIESRGMGSVFLTGLWLL